MKCTPNERTRIILSLIMSLGSTLKHFRDFQKLLMNAKAPLFVVILHVCVYFYV